MLQELGETDLCPEQDVSRHSLSHDSTGLAVSVHAGCGRPLLSSADQEALVDAVREAKEMGGYSG